MQEKTGTNNCERNGISASTIGFLMKSSLLKLVEMEAND